MGNPRGGSDELDSLRPSFDCPLLRWNRLLLPGQSVCAPEPTEPKDFLDSIVRRSSDNSFELPSRPWTVASHTPEFVGSGAQGFSSSLDNLWNHLDFACRADSPGPLNGRVTRKPDFGPSVALRKGTLAIDMRTNSVRKQSAFFSPLFVFVLALESLFPSTDGLAGPGSCLVLIPRPWSTFFIAMILAGSITWLGVRLRLLCS